MDSPLTLKAIFVGDTGTGKSSLMYRLAKDEFQDPHTCTIGCAFLYHEIPSTGIRLQLWDLAGNERFRSTPPNFARQSDIIFACIDVSSFTVDAPATAQMALTRLSYWIADVKAQILATSARDARTLRRPGAGLLVVVATKADKVPTDELEVRMAFLRDRVAEWDDKITVAAPTVVSTSALTGEGVAEMALVACRMAQNLIPSCTAAIGRPGAVRLPSVNDGIPTRPVNSRKNPSRFYCWA